VEAPMSLPTSSKYEALQMSLDGYIRMTFDAFTKLEFTLRRSWEDEALHEDLRSEGIETSCAGYCEWGTDATRSVSIGWAWFGLPCGRLAVAPGGISTNVMLVTRRTRYDLGQSKTDELLQVWLASEPWDSASISASQVFSQKIEGRLPS